MPVCSLLKGVSNICLDLHDGANTFLIAKRNEKEKQLWHFPEQRRYKQCVLKGCNREQTFFPFRFIGLPQSDQ